MTDIELLKSCQQGQKKGWRQLFSTYSGSVFRWAQFFGLDRAAAEEITQDVFVTAYKKIDSVRRDEQLAPWLFQIVRRHAANHRRRHWVKKTLGLDTNKVDVQLQTDPTANRELSVDMRRILVDMPIKLCEVLILHDMDGYTQKEVAQILRIAPGTVASRLKRARTHFGGAWQNRDER